MYNRLDRTKKKEIRIQLGTASVVYKQFLYFSGVGINGMFRTDLGSGETFFIKEFSQETDGFQLHGSAFIRAGKVWLVPRDGQKLACFDLENYEIEYYDLPFSDKKVPKSIAGISKFMAARWDDNRFFVTSIFSNSIVLVNMENREITEYSDVLLDEEIASYCTIGMGCLWITLVEGGRLLSIDLESKTIRRIECDSFMYGYSGIVSYEGKLWFAPRKADNIMYYDPSKEMFGRLYLCNAYSEARTYRAMAVNRGKLYVLPFNADKFFTIDTHEDYSVNMIDISDKEISYMIDIESDTNLFYISTGGCGKLIQIDETNIAKSIEIRIDSELLVKLLIRNYGLNNIHKYWGDGVKIIREKDLGLSGFIEII